MLGKQRLPKNPQQISAQVIDCKPECEGHISTPNKTENVLVKKKGFWVVP